MKKIIMFLGLVFCMSISAQAAEQNFSSEFKQVQKIYSEMTPEQKAEVMESARKIQAELAAMPVAERQKYYRDALATMKTIDFDNVDVNNLDTSKSPQSAVEISEMMDSQRQGKAKPAMKSSASKPATMSANPSKPVLD